METYDKNNIFAKILRDEAPSVKVYEDDLLLCFENKFKEAKIHLLIIPKGEYICFDDFVSKSAPETISSFFTTIKNIARQHGLHEKGYKLVTNNGSGAGQSVFHFHFHLLSGDHLHHT